MSKIFTDAELKSIEDFNNKDRKDKTGIFSRRVKPKIIELLDDWFPKKQQLKDLIKR